MTNKEYILKITDKNRERRIDKIVSCLTKGYFLQRSEDILNIVVPAKTREIKLTLMAHHDVVPGSWGYNDNSSGVVTLLKLQEYLPENVEIVFTDQEESGGRGCQYYLENSPRPKQVINVDVVGLGDRIFYESYVKPPALKIPTSMEYYKDIPFSDSRILEAYRVPNILILTGSSQGTLLKKIFEAQHCNKDDSKLDLISEDTMNLVFETLRTMIVA